MSFAQFSPGSSPAHAWFSDHLPEIRSRASACFSRLHPVEREEAVADVTASIFAQCLRAAERGVLSRLTPYHTVAFTSRQYRNGRRFSGSSTTDVLAEGTQRVGRVVVRSLFDSNAQSPSARSSESTVGGGLAQILSDRRSSDPFDQVRVNVDYPSVLQREQVSQKGQQLFQMLARSWGDAGTVFAAELGISAPRICELKRQLAKALSKHGYAPGGQDAEKIDAVSPQATAPSVGGRRSRKTPENTALWAAFPPAQIFSR